MRKSSLLLALFAIISTADIKAQQADMGIFNHLAAGVGVGTTGVSFNLAAPVTDHLAITASVDWIPDFRRKDNINYYLYQNLSEYGLGQWESGTHTLTMKGGLGRVQGSIILNVYPFRNSSVYVAAGAYFGGNRVLDMDGNSDDLRSDINQVKALYDKVVAYSQATGKQMPDMPAGYEDMLNSDGHVNAYIKTKAFRPYLGIGYGRVVPRDHRLAFNCELGLQFSGKYSLSSDNTSDAVLHVLGVDDKYADIIDNLNKFKLYPVLKFRLAGRIF